MHYLSECRCEMFTVVRDSQKRVQETMFSHSDKKVQKKIFVQM